MTPPQLRPRVEGAREEEILDATVRLLLTAGYDRLTLDAVAKEARASKATLYRRWDGKASLVVDAMVRAKQAPQVEVQDTGTLRGDLLGTFCGRHGLGRGDTSGLLGAVMTAVSNDPEFAERFRAAFIAPKVEASLRIYERAVARGEIGDDVDLDVIAPSLAGIVLHRGFVLGLPVDDDVVRRVIDHVILPAVGLGVPTPDRDHLAPPTSHHLAPPAPPHPTSQEVSTHDRHP